VFLELAANADRCPHCNSVNVWDGIQRPFTCFNCQNEIPFHLYLSVDHGFGNESKILAAPGITVRRHHLNIVKFDAACDEVIGTIEQHPKERRASILRNNTVKTWRYKTEDGGEYTVEPNQARALLPGCELMIEGVKARVKER
jgi:hypothetical protein